MYDSHQELKLAQGQVILNVHLTLEKTERETIAMRSHVRVYEEHRDLLNY